MAQDPPPPPATETELMERVLAISGQTLGSLAADFGVAVADDPIRAKGWAGQLLERVLGANAASAPVPDFQDLGVELKTIPVTPAGQPLESTYVCNVPLAPSAGPALWATSTVCLKLTRVLWLPIIVSGQAALGERPVGRGMLWSPSPRQALILRRDWEELMDLVCLGQLDRITSHLGECLQIRPKAANARSRRWGVGERGERIRTGPRGFYLRARFTAGILRDYYAG